MTEYRRALIEGATYFFTVNCAQRRGNRILVDHIDALRQSQLDVKQRHPFRIDAIVILQDHLHCVWTLPPDDADYKTRWALIKAGFSRAVPKGERLSASRIKRGERGIWQRRYWEHVIRDEHDLESHIDYIHWNPVKHGLVEKVSEYILRVGSPIARAKATGCALRDPTLFSRPRPFSRDPFLAHE